MAPIILNAAANVAGNVIDSIKEHFSHHHGVKKASTTAEDDFDAEMANAQAASPVTGAVTMDATASAADAQSALVKQVLGTPEVATALAGANPSKPVQVELNPGGNIALRNANGEVHALKVSDHTRDLVAKLYSARESSGLPGKMTATAVLAVDPAHTSTAEWSKLPARAA